MQRHFVRSDELQNGSQRQSQVLREAGHDLKMCNPLQCSPVRLRSRYPVRKTGPVAALEVYDALVLKKFADLSYPDLRSRVPMLGMTPIVE